MAPLTQSCQLDAGQFGGAGTGSLLFGLMLQGGDQNGTTLLDADLTATLTYGYTSARSVPESAATAVLLFGGLVLLGLFRGVTPTSHFPCSRRIRRRDTACRPEPN